MKFEKNDIVKIKSSLRFVVEDGPNNFNQYNLLEIGEDGVAFENWTMNGDDIELIERPFTKESLKSGMLLVDENEKRWLVVDMGNELVGFIENRNKTIDIENAFDDNFNSISDLLQPGCNIIAVYDVLEKNASTFPFRIENRKLLWERK